jgi:hypothetical protein
VLHKLLKLSARRFGCSSETSEACGDTDCWLSNRQTYSLNTSQIKLIQSTAEAEDAH